MKVKASVLITFFLCVQLIPAFSIIRIDTMYAYTTYYSVDSSKVYLVTKSQFPNTPCGLQNMFVTDSINFSIVNFCIADGLISATCARTDTIFLGIKPNGLLIINVTFSLTNDHCVTSFQSKTKQDSVYLGSTGVDSPPLIQESKILFKNITSTKIFGINSSTQQIIMNLFTIDGKRIQTTTINQLNNFEIDITPLPSGLYFLELQDENQRWVKKFIKE